MLKNASFPHHKLLFLITWLEVCDVDFFDFGLLSSYIFSTENIRARKIMKGVLAKLFEELFVLDYYLELNFLR